MPKKRTDLELAIGKLIVSVQRSWNDEVGSSEADESLSVMYKCHDLLQAAKAEKISDLLKGHTVSSYVGALWLSAHPQVLLSVEAVTTAMTNGNR